jgi:hypothetical protein
MQRNAQCALQPVAGFPYACIPYLGVWPLLFFLTKVDPVLDDRGWEVSRVGNPRACKAVATRTSAIAMLAGTGFTYSCDIPVGSARAGTVYR